MRLKIDASLALLLIGVTCAQAQHLEPQLDPNVGNFPIVLTPTRLRQSLADVPASVTVITAETIRKYGIMNVPDALRLVPGMAITQVNGNDYRINYHGTNILDPRRMNVLVDGISVYRPALARVDWKQLPVAIEDIDRIEVTRGPNSAAYGANSMLAIVNIITKHPSDVERLMLSTTLGSLNSRTVTGRFATTLGSTALRVSVTREEDSGYDVLSRVPDAHDSTRLSRLTARSHTQFGERSSLGLEAAFVGGTIEVPFVDMFQKSFPDQDSRDYYLGAVWTTSLTPTHEIQLRANYSNHRLRQDWVTCPPTVAALPELFTLFAANPRYASAILAGRIPTGGSATDNALAAAAIAAIGQLGARALQPTCGTPNQNMVESRADVELQDTYVFSPRLRLVAGFGLRNDRGSAVTYLAGAVSNTSYRVFGNLEYKPYDWLNLNVGGYSEHDNLTGSAFSPRIAANAHLSERQTVRVAFSKGTRVPDIFEQRARWTYTASDLNPPLNGSTSGRFYQSAVARGNLREEHITSRELGYLLRVQPWGLLLDTRIFNDTLTDLISEKLYLANFEPTNSNAVRLRGTELQATIAPSERWSLFLVYGYLENKATTELERTQYSRHSGAAGATRTFGDGWRWSLAYYGASGDGVGQTYYGREDLTLSKMFKLQSAPLTTSLTVRRLDKRSVRYFLNFAEVLESKYDDRYQIYGYLKLSL